MMKVILAMVLCESLVTTGCSAQWINVALQDLPVLTQMALNIATLVTALQSGQQISTAEAAAIQNVSAEASRDLNLLQTLYNESGWTQITAEGNPGAPEAPMGSGRQRRRMGREQWRRSGSSKI